MSPTLVIVLESPVPYANASRFQERLVAARQQGLIPDIVLLLEHTPVVTMGMRARTEHLLIPPEALRCCGIDFEYSPRGGDVTYHAPGQLVVYPILKLAGEEADAHAYVSMLEELAIRTAAHYGITAERRKGKTGAWTQQGKLAAIGVKIRRWVTSHGMSFNVAPDLTGFTHIVPCGLHGESVTSLQLLLGDRCPCLPDVRETLIREFCGLRKRPAARVTPSSFTNAFGIPLP